MKQKKMILLVLAVLMVLLVALVLWKPWNKVDDNTVTENGTDTPDDSGENSANQNDPSENGTDTATDPSNQNDSTQGSITILEDEGDIIIEIPEDQESDGF